MTNHVDRQTLIRERAALGIIVEEKIKHTVNEISKSGNFHVGTPTLGLHACLLDMTALIQDTMAETTDAPNEWTHNFYLETYLLAGFVMGVVHCSLMACLWHAGCYLLRCRREASSTPGLEPCSPQASSSTEAHEQEQPCEESEPAGGSKPALNDPEDKQDSVDVGTQAEEPGRAPRDAPDSFWKDVAGSDRAAVLRRLTNEQLANFARGMHVHEVGFVASFEGCATARQMRYIVDLCEWAGEPLNTQTFRTTSAASEEIDRPKPIVEGIRRRS